MSSSNQKSGDKTIFGIVHSPKNCIHCSAMKPEWDKMIENMKKTGGFDKTEYHEFNAELDDYDKKMEEFKKNPLHAKLSANGFPTIFKINGGVIQYYEGERTMDKMQAWVLGEKKLGGKTTKKIFRNKSHKSKSTKPKNKKGTKKRHTIRRSKSWFW